MENGYPLNSVYTVTANCHDCYRCVRVCPVKAISVRGGQASIKDELCISCGTCVRECPQHAKTIRGSLQTVKELLASGRPVAASIAPSFAALYRGWRSTRLPAALRQLGFAYISETAEGAALVTAQSFDQAEPGSICTACPAVVNYVEKYHPEYVERLITVASPMIAHARLLKKRLGVHYAVVFIGPCAAKKQEALRPENEGLVDGVLTFDELDTWLAEAGIELANCSETGFRSQGDLQTARLFPLPGGMMKTGAIGCNNLDGDTIHVSGAEEIERLLEIPSRQWPFKVAECLFCSGGCICGPGMPASMSQVNLFQRRRDILAYAEKSQPNQGELDFSVDAPAQFAPRPLPQPEFDESEIQRVLAATDKSNPELQMNCGACGYKSCRDNAIAVLRGLAEPEMCMPYMRRLAQQHTDRIIETNPNGVVVLDQELHILNANPAFMKMFHCGADLIGRRISYFMDADGFEKMAAGVIEEHEEIRFKFGMKYHEQLYSLRGEQQYVGLFTDISNLTFDERQIDLIKIQTLNQAQELLDHQIRFAQEMAHFLGRSTAQSEELVKRMVDLYQQKPGKEQTSEIL